MSYTPSSEVLEKYAQVLCNYALNHGAGVNKGEVVLVRVPECAKPILVALQKILLQSGAHAILQLIPDDISRTYMEFASDEQLDFFPDKYLKGLLEQVDHIIHISATTDKHELQGIDPARLMKRQSAFKPYIKWRTEKEEKGKLTWTLAMYGTEEMAKGVDMSMEEYWQHIITACYLDEEDPVIKWKELQKEQKSLIANLNALPVEKFHVEAEDINLWITLGENRTWLGGTGRNIPSFEVFVSPDARYTEGEIAFNIPLFAQGCEITDIYLRFENGLVVESRASQNEHVLKEMLNAKGGSRVGEFSLTDKRHSRINTYMGETLYDENFGGEHGNTHIAIGKSYDESYAGDISQLSQEERNELGFNFSVVHTDIFSTKPRIVTAHLQDGTTKIIYKNGIFLL